MICQNTSLAALCFIEHSKTDFYCHFLEKCSMLLVHWRCTLLNLVTRLPRWNRSKLVISYHLSDMSWKVIDFCNFLISKHKRMNYKKEVSFTLHLLVEFQNGWDRSHLLPFQSPTNLREGWWYLSQAPQAVGINAQNSRFHGRIYSNDWF